MAFAGRPEKLILCDIGLGAPFLFDLRGRHAQFLNRLGDSESLRFGGQHHASGELSREQAAERLRQGAWILASDSSWLQTVLTQVKLEKVDAIVYRKKKLGLYRVR